MDDSCTGEKLTSDLLMSNMIDATPRLLPNSSTTLLHDQLSGLAHGDLHIGNLAECKTHITDFSVCVTTGGNEVNLISEANVTAIFQQFDSVGSSEGGLPRADSLEPFMRNVSMGDFLELDSIGPGTDSVEPLTRMTRVGECFPVASTKSC